MDHIKRTRNRKLIKLLTKNIIMSSLFVMMISIFFIYLTSYAVSIFSSFLIEKFEFTLFGEDKLGVIVTVFSYVLTYLITIVVSPLFFGVYENIQGRIHGKPMKVFNIFNWFGDTKLLGKAVGTKAMWALRAVPAGIISLIPLGILYTVGASGISSGITTFISKNWISEAVDAMMNITMNTADKMNMTANTSVMTNAFLQMLVLIGTLIIFTLLMLRYSLVDYIIVKDPSIKINDAFRLSASAMKGKYGETIVFYLSFYIIALITSIICMPFAFVVIYLYLFCAKLIYANYLVYNHEHTDDLFDAALGNDINYPILNVNHIALLFKRISNLISGGNTNDNIIINQDDNNNNYNNNNFNNNGDDDNGNNN